MIKKNKLSSWLIASVVLLGSGISSHAANITGFGTGDFTFDAGSSSVVTATPSATSFAFTGSGDSFIAGTLSSVTAGLGSINTLYLTGTVTTYTPVSPVFFVDVYDAEFDYRTYTGSFSNFTSGVAATYILTYTSTTLNDIAATFSGNVSAVGLRIGSSGGSVSISLDNLSTVPEPSTYAAIFGAAALGFVIVRRRFASK